MAADIHGVLVSETWRPMGMVARADGSPIISGTVNYYLKCLTGTNAGKWYRNSDQTWQSSETENAMTHQADGGWTITLTKPTGTTVFRSNIIYYEYAKESGDLHVAAEGRLLRGEADENVTAWHVSLVNGFSTAAGHSRNDPLISIPTDLTGSTELHVYGVNFPDTGHSPIDLSSLIAYLVDGHGGEIKGGGATTPMLICAAETTRLRDALLDRQNDTYPCISVGDGYLHASDCTLSNWGDETEPGPVITVGRGSVLLVDCIVRGDITVGTGGKVLLVNCLRLEGTDTGDVEYYKGDLTEADVLAQAGAALTAWDKTGFALSATGLDAIPTTAPAGPAATFREMFVQVWRRFFTKVVKNKANSTIKTYADNGSTVITTQTYSESDTTDTQGAAS